MEEKIYEINNIQEVREKFDVVELSRKIKKKGDILILSQELKIKPRILNSAFVEGRVLSIFPNLNKCKADILLRLRTDRELRLFAEKYDIYNISARQLIKLIKKWNQDIQKNPLILVSPSEHSLIIGSLLGDSSIRQRDKNSCFRTAHSLKQENYINFKLDILKNFNISEFNKKTRIINGRKVNMINLATKTHPIFNYYKDLFYKQGIKKIDLKILNKLNPNSLAYWICDDGSYDRTQGHIVICTNSYSLEEHKLMKKFFNDKFGLDPTIGFRDGKYYYLRFKQEDSRKLIEIIKPFIPNCMKYKIGDKND